MLSRNRTFAFPCALAFALALIVAPPPAFAEQEPVQPDTTEGEQDSAPRDGWDAAKKHWYEDGEMARDHAFYDPDSDAWYWADADGSIACDKDVFIPVDESDRDKGGKWVRFDENRAMVKGEDAEATEAQTRASGQGGAAQPEGQSIIRETMWTNMDKLYSLSLR